MFSDVVVILLASLATLMTAFEDKHRRDPADVDPPGVATPFCSKHCWYTSFEDHTRDRKNENNNNTHIYICVTLLVNGSVGRRSIAVVFTICDVRAENDVQFDCTNANIGW